mmetsp:Transcript_24371/g.67768  ORF Transcript_24371/g.67768 Transcript_24371/m.67768 type:complete len:84 (+) Transcript_24371:123-374(+)
MSTTAEYDRKCWRRRATRASAASSGRQEVTSSSKTTRGCRNKARAVHTICCWPCDNVSMPPRLMSLGSSPESPASQPSSLPMP